MDAHRSLGWILDFRTRRSVLVQPVTARGGSPSLLLQIPSNSGSSITSSSPGMEWSTVHQAAPHCRCWCWWLASAAAGTRAAQYTHEALRISATKSTVYAHPSTGRPLGAYGSGLLCRVHERASLAVSLAGTMRGTLGETAATGWQASATAGRLSMKDILGQCRQGWCWWRTGRWWAPSRRRSRSRSVRHCMSSWQRCPGRPWSTGIGLNINKGHSYNRTREPAEADEAGSECKKPLLTIPAPSSSHVPGTQPQGLTGRSAAPRGCRR